MKTRPLQNIKLMKKIAALVLLGLAFIGITSVMGVINSQQGLDAIQQISDGAVTPNKKFKELSEDFIFIHQTAIGVMAAVETTGPAAQNTLEKVKIIEQRLKELKPIIQDDPVLVEHLSKVEKEWDILKAFPPQLAEAYLSEDLDGVFEIFAFEWQDRYLKFQEHLAEINAYMLQKVDHVVETQSNLLDRNLTLIKIMVPIIVFFFILFAYFIAKITARPLEQIAREVSTDTKNLAKQIPISGNDEAGVIAHSINHFLNEMRELIGEVSDSIVATTHTSQKLIELSNEVDGRIKNQNTKLETIMGSIGVIQSAGENVKTNADETLENVGEGQQRLSNLSGKVESITENIMSEASQEQVIAENLTRLSQDATQIKDVLQVIKDIADQTNLLALNAAIEAARAGEHGRGFAVVADEVRKLAERTQKSIGEIDSTINVVVQSIGDVSGQMESTSKNTLETSHETELMRDEIVQVTDFVHGTVSLAQGTAEISNDVALRSQEIRGMIQEINDVSEQSTESMRVAMVQSKRLDEDVKRLQDVIKEFTV